MQSTFKAFVLTGRQRVQRNSIISLAVLLAVAAMLFSSVAVGQQLTGTISGTAYDQAGAIVPNAKVEVSNEASGDVRRTVTNSTGFFTVTALPPGSYSVIISAAGFARWEQKAIALNQGDARSLPNIALKVGSLTENIEVISSSEALAPQDTGEVSQTLNQEMVHELGLVGRDAGELIKIMPGMAFTNGLNQGSSFTDKSVSSNTGPVGAYSSNGTQPNGAMAYMLDGANLLDPGNVGTQIANVNQDMTSEVKVLMSSYSAEFAKGPVVFQAFGKSGGKDFHGEGYGYFRNGVLDSIDSANKAVGATRATLPPEHYYYMGGNIGGPILLPFLHINRNRNKLFFWFGYEYMNQVPVGQTNRYFVPDSAMLGGNFSSAELSQYTASGWSGASTTLCPSGSSWTSTCSATGSTPLPAPGGIIPASQIDPNGLILLKLLPQPNMTASSNNGFNYNFIEPGTGFLTATNRWEQSEKVDYAINDNTKLTVSYTYQKEADLHPIATWWAPNQGVPYPSSMNANTPSDVIMGNFTHVFSPTLVNEVVVTYARYTNGLALANPAAVDPTALGMTTKGLFGVSEKQIPNTLSWSGPMAEFMPQADFYASGNNFFGAVKSDPAVYDNVTKVWGTHSLKFGFYWDQNGNAQSMGPQPTNGQYDFENYGGASSGNVYADELTGRVAGYTQGNVGPIITNEYHQTSFYAQDSWKATRRLTINYGVRFDRVGQYYDPSGPGYWVWNQAAYINQPYVSKTLTPNLFNTGLQNHASNASIPVSGSVTPWAYPLPRIGVAYDLFGNGKTVVRGGFAIFKYQVGTNAPSGADTAAAGAFVYGSGAFVGLANTVNLTGLPTGQGAINGGSPNVMNMGDDRLPSTADWNFSISQQAPWHSLLEVSYVGNHSYDMMLFNNGQALGLNNPNAIAPGTYFKPDPKDGLIHCIQGYQCDGSFQANDYFPLVNYQNINIAGHGSYANYNSLQVSWNKTAGPAVFMTNYTFGKVLGIRDGYSGNGPQSGNMVNPFDLASNYGVLAYDHTQIINLAYVFHLPKPIHGNPFLEGVINGWELSGYTTHQSGAPIQSNTGETLNVNWPSNVSNSVFLGTNNQILVPMLTCDPRNGLSSGQYFNPSCFTPPPAGQQGNVIWPYIKGPGYFNSDLSLMKNFKIREGKSLQFRVHASNFLNHANPQFNTNGSQDLNLHFGGGYGTTNTNTVTTGTPAYSTGMRIVEFAVKFYF
jgi:hypothetical protein